MDTPLVIIAYIEKNINDLKLRPTEYNYAYCNGLLGALFVAGIVPYKKYNIYYDRVRELYKEKPEEPT